MDQKVASALVIGGGAGAAVGSFMPWVTATAPFVGSISRSGVDGGGDGLVSAGCGVGLVLIGWGLRTNPRGSLKILAIIAALIVGLVAFVDYGDISDRVDAVSSAGVASIGAGLYLVIAGAGAALIGALLVQTVESPTPTIPTGDPDTSEGWS